MKTNCITFNPGPSQLSCKTMQDINEIVESGLLSVSHRSSTFIEVSRQAIDGIRNKMHIPADYHIFLQPSSTAAMDTLLRNLVNRRSYHFTHGAFSKRFHQSAVEIGLDSPCSDSPWELAIEWQTALIPRDIELIAVTHNETSSGLMWPQHEICALCRAYPQLLLAVDVTSSFGGMAMDWLNADVWFGSVQKCLGLPSGLGFLIVSPRAFQRAQDLLKKKGGVSAWQRFDVMAEMMKQYQTVETPNMLLIALLARQMANWDLDHIERDLRRKATLLYENSLAWQPYVRAEEWRSLTVANFVVNNPNDWYQRAEEAHMRLGKGYGPLKDSCIRIANFPAISFEVLQTLVCALKEKN